MCCRSRWPPRAGSRAQIVPGARIGAGVEQQPNGLDIVAGGLAQSSADEPSNWAASASARASSSARTR